MRAQRQELRERLRESIAVFAEETLRIPKYDFNKSTKENYQASRDSKTYGEYTQPYAEIRKTLDINYHGVYTLERQEVQDKMIAEVMDKGQCEAHPWIIFTAGAMGAGKSRTMTWLSEKGIFPLSQVVLIDPDMFKSEFPEWKDYVRINADAAGTHTRRESGYMCEIAQEAAMRQKKHLWVDGSLRDGEWYQSVFRKIAEDHPAYQIAIFHVNADEDVVKARAQRRGEETGRFVPLAELLDSIRRVPQTVDLLTPLSHFVATIDNSGNVPRFSNGIIFKDIVKVERVADPKVKGVDLYISDFQRPITDRLSKDFFSDPTQAAVTCVKTGKVELADDIDMSQEGEEVFQQARSLLFKSVNVRRLYDKETDTLIYVSYSTRLNKSDDENKSRFKTTMCAIKAK